MVCGRPDGRGICGGTGTCTCLAESLGCPPGTITALLISYTPTQNKKLKKRKLDDYSHSNIICNCIKFGVWLKKNSITCVMESSVILFMNKN